MRSSDGGLCGRVSGGTATVEAVQEVETQVGGGVGGRGPSSEEDLSSSWAWAPAPVSSAWVVYWGEAVGLGDVGALGVVRMVDRGAPSLAGSVEAGDCCVEWSVETRALCVGRSVEAGGPTIAGEAEARPPGVAASFDVGPFCVVVSEEAGSVDAGGSGGVGPLGASGLL